MSQPARGLLLLTCGKACLLLCCFGLFIARPQVLHLLCPQTSGCQGRQHLQQQQQQNNPWCELVVAET